jgi:hypothetical protein
VSEAFVVEMRMRHQSEPAAKENSQGRHYTRKSGSRAG